MAAVEGPSHLVRYTNPAFCQLLDKSSEQLVGLPFCKELPDSDKYVTWLDHVLRTGKPDSDMEQEHFKPDYGFLSLSIWPVFVDEGTVGIMIQVNETPKPREKTQAMNEALLRSALRQHELTEQTKMLNVELQTEITERKNAEQRVQLLMSELAHRGQNQLAVLQSIASRSLTGTRPLAEAREVLMQRLCALGRSQSALLAEGFTGVPLAAIIRLEFAAFSERIKADGPDVMLNPKAAQTFALIVHELATNACKYGALSEAGGVIDINWSIDGENTKATLIFTGRSAMVRRSPLRPAKASVVHCSKRR
jgi:two-component sensor histidine kinase